MKILDEPLLPLELEVEDARVLSQNLSSGEDLYVTYSNGRYWLKSRIFNYDVDWVTHFELIRPVAQKIVSLGYADWWINVDKSVR